MRNWKLAAALMATVALPQGAFATDIEVTHWWTSGGEAAAVKVFADAVTAAGMTWVDGAIAGGDNARSIIISRISGGDPMEATQLNTGRDAEDLVKAGLMTDLTELAEKEGWKDIIRPAKLLDAFRSAIPLGRLGQPDDLASALAFFGSDDAGFITGQVISVSGGLTMHG